MLSELCGPGRLELDQRAGSGTGLDTAAEAETAEGSTAMSKALDEARKPMHGLMNETRARVLQRRGGRGTRERSWVCQVAGR